MSAQWPSALSSSLNLFTAVNLLQTTLTANISSSGPSVIALASTTGFPTAGAVTIDNEVIFYTGISGNALTGPTRGADGTTAQAHSAGVPVGATVVANHVNALNAEVVAIETDLHSRFGYGSTLVAIPSGVPLSVASDVSFPNTLGVTRAVNVKDYGAVGDGVTDDSEAIGVAMGTGKDVYFPATANHYKISQTIGPGANGQRIFGDGPQSKIIQTGINANSTVIFVNTLSGVVIEGLWLVPNVTTANVVYGWGVTIANSTNCVVRNCQVSGHYRGGVFLQNSSYCQVTSNIIHDALPDDSGSGVDIYVAYGGSFNIIEGNTMTNGSGVGVAVQSLNGITGADCSNNIISGNVIDTQSRYGIVLYKGGTGNVEFNIVSENVIRHISGAAHTSSDYPFGAGIYVQGAEYSVVNGNIVDDTNSSTALDQLAPAGIGSTNCSDIVISGNRVSNTHSWYGILVRDPNAEGVATGFANISGNVIYNCSIGVTVQHRGRAKVTGNSVDTCDTGILINNTVTQYPGVTIQGNSVLNARVGAEAHYVVAPVISGNQFVGFSQYGILVYETVVDAVIAGNIVRNGASATGTIGIDIEALSGCLVTGNFVTANAIGLYMASACSVTGNKISDNTVNISGAGVPVPHVSTALVTDAADNIVSSAVSATELDYLSGVTSSVQTQLNSKAADSAAVHKTGDESIAGNKSFTTLIKAAPGTAVDTNYPIFQSDACAGDTFHTHQYRTTGVTTAKKIAFIDDFGAFVMVSGSDGSGARFFDLLVCTYGSAAPSVISSFSTAGSPAVRTYSMASNTDLKVAMASGTYTIDTVAFVLGPN